MKSTTTTHKSRWGYHPCNYELFLKLKSLHRWYWQTVFDFHRWNRWRRKQEHNRHGPEPAYCPTFVKNETWHKPVSARGEEGYKVYPKTVTAHGLVALYQQARLPRPEPTVTFDQDTQSLIEGLYNEAAAYCIG